MRDVVTLLTTIRWQDVLDISLNSYILFRIYVLFHQTNAFRVLVGVAILWVSQKIASGMGLIITSWVLQAIIALAAIIVIVVFRNELRAALQLQNLRSFLWGSPSRKVTLPSQTIADAVMQMGRKRIGAILVLPGREDITEIVHGGIPWHGRISQEMIMSIFWPNNPVHDGAIIIDGDQIKEVAVLLPLSQRSDLPSFYGTRHRAAIGLAERSDALVVVVSEERGRVSLAHKGSIRAVSDVEELQQVLSHHIDPTRYAPKSLTERLHLRTALAACASLIIITSAWFAFTRSKDLVMSLEVPIEFLNRPPELEILEVTPTQVTLHMSGSSTLMKSIKPQQIEVKVNLKQSTAGKNVIPLSQENVSLPPGIVVNRIDPHVVSITLDTVITKNLAVQVDWEGRLNNQLILSSAIVSPSTVTVSGGKSILHKLSTIYTVPIQLDTISRSGTISVPLVITPSSLKLVSGSPERVVVEYMVRNRATMALLPP